MATAEQIKSLIRSYIIDDSEHFVTIALQVAAHEARLGHGALAHDIRKLVDKARTRFFQDYQISTGFKWPCYFRETICLPVLIGIVGVSKKAYRSNHL